MAWDCEVSDWGKRGKSSPEMVTAGGYLRWQKVLLPGESALQWWGGDEDAQCGG